MLLNQQNEKSKCIRVTGPTKQKFTTEMQKKLLLIIYVSITVTLMLMYG